MPFPFYADLLARSRVPCTGLQILDSEPESDKAWAQHNGCTGPLTNPENTSATYGNRESPEPVHTTAIKWVWTGCPKTAPVEYWQIVGAPHGGAHSIDGRDPFWIVFDFWGRVENATKAEQLGQPTM